MFHSMSTAATPATQLFKSAASKIAGRAWALDWNQVEGNCKEVKGKVKEKGAKLTDDDLTEINGKRDQPEGRLQARYGDAKEQARKEVDTWFSKLP